jgi:DNA-binding response OmpR family regulator
MPEEKNILYVEDSIISQKVTERMLKDVGKVRSVQTVEEAKTALEQGGIDLLMADFMLKESYIWPLIKWVRFRWTETQLPLIIITSALDELLLNKLLRNGVNEALSKPVDASRLQQYVRQMLAQPYVRPKAAGAPVEVACVHWDSGVECAGYCPETGFMTTGKTRQEVSDALTKHIKQALAQGKDLGYINEIKAAGYVVNPGN